MRKLIHSKFELDLSPFKISDTEENNWFSDTFFTKYTFPFNIDITDDLDIAFGFISLYNTSPETYYEVKYIHDDKFEDAIFEILTKQDKISCIVRFGLEQLPSFDKTLSQLSLDKFVLAPGISIYDHAETIVSKTWPAVNYNFPQIHKDKDSDGVIWSSFLNIINNRIYGSFVVNTVDLVNKITENKNIIQPFPYLLHVLQRGMIDAGYELDGKILTDPRLIKATIFADVAYHLENKLKKDAYYGGPGGMVKVSSEALNPGVQGTQWKVKGASTKTIVGIGNFRFSGSNNTYPLPNESAYYRIKINGVVVHELVLASYGTVQPTVQPRSIDFNYKTTTNETVIEIECLGRVIGDYVLSSYFNIVPLDLYADGSGFETIINENKIDLTAAVPLITFGDLVNVIKNWFNYDLSVVDNKAIMNPIEDEINYDGAVDLTFCEIKNPLITYSQGSSFLLKFEEIDNKEFPYVPVYQNISEIKNSGYVVNGTTNTIEIKALPLPLVEKAGVKTASVIERNDSKLFIVPYDGLKIGLNVAGDIEEYLLPAVHLQNWFKWFNFRIKPDGFTWVFKAWNEQISILKAKSKIFAYKKFHIIKTINKTEISPDQYEVEIETESLE